MTNGEAEFISLDELAARGKKINRPSHIPLGWSATPLWHVLSVCA